MRKEKAGMNLFAASLCLALSLLAIVFLSGCEQDSSTDGSFASPGNDKDFSQLTSPEQQEAAYNYQAYFRPALDDSEQPYVGDTMPFYEDGVYYIYYLKEKGDSRNHSIYLATTTDFVSYTEYDKAILESAPGPRMTGSVLVPW